MAKKDKTDGTPIEFYIPPTITGRGSRVPIPINQPNWIYKYNLNSKPGFSEWLGIGIILTVAIVLGVLLVASSANKLPLWIVLIAFGIFLVFLVRSAVIRTINHKQEVEDDENIVPPAKRKKNSPNTVKITNKPCCSLKMLFGDTLILRNLLWKTRTNVPAKDEE